MFKILAKRKLRRQLDDFRKQIRFILHADDDILELPQKETLKKLLDNSEEIGQEPADKIRTFLNEAQPLIVRNSPRFRSCRIRELLDVLAVACMVAFGIRGLFLQPFKIPTSSMQPTLFGIHFEESKTAFSGNSVKRFFSFLNYSRRHVDLVAKEAGRFGTEISGGMLAILVLASDRYRLAHR